jgi:hypothetical protein
MRVLSHTDCLLLVQQSDVAVVFWAYFFSAYLRPEFFKLNTGPPLLTLLWRPAEMYTIEYAEYMKSKVQR